LDLYFVVLEDVAEHAISLSSDHRRLHHGQRVHRRPVRDHSVYYGGHSPEKNDREGINDRKLQRDQSELSYKRAAICLGVYE
jgi:hypothetical protein